MGYIAMGFSLSYWAWSYKDMDLKLQAAIFHYVEPDNKDNTAEKRMRDKESQSPDDIKWATGSNWAWSQVCLDFIEMWVNEFHFLLTLV